MTRIIIIFFNFFFLLLLLLLYDIEIYSHVRYFNIFSSWTVAITGEVCISILHEPGEDKYGYERPEERWLPVHTVETIMISVISLLTDPNDESPANIDAAVLAKIFV